MILENGDTTKIETNEIRMSIIHMAGCGGFILVFGFVSLVWALLFIHSYMNCTDSL